MEKQELEALILSYKVELKKDLILQYVKENTYIKDFVKIGHILNKYDKTFNISSKRYGNVKKNESK